MLFELKDMAEAGMVPGLLAYRDSLDLGGAILYIATTLVACGRPFPLDPSRCARCSRTYVSAPDTA